MQRAKKLRRRKYITAAVVQATNKGCAGTLVPTGTCTKPAAKANRHSWKRATTNRGAMQQHADGRTARAQKTRTRAGFRARETWTNERHQPAAVQGRTEEFTNAVRTSAKKGRRGVRLGISTFASRRSVCAGGAFNRRQENRWRRPAERSLFAKRQGFARYDHWCDERALRGRQRHSANPAVEKVVADQRIRSSERRR